MNLREKIINEFGGLSPELQRAAEFSLQNASQLVVLSMRAFAAEAGVKPATLLRLAQRLGYRGWSELKSDFIDDLGLRNDTYVSKAEKMMARGTQTQLYKEVFQAHQANLTFTQNENAQQMEQAVTLLDSAENVYICGFRASFPIAWSLFYVYRLFNRQVSLIDGLASNIESLPVNSPPGTASYSLALRPIHANHWMFYGQPGRPGRRSSPLPIRRFPP